VFPRSSCQAWSISGLGPPAKRLAPAVIESVGFVDIFKSGSATTDVG
jgi:hypothetical protein